MTRITGGVVALLAFIAVLSLPIAAQRRPHQHPRLANLFLKWHLSEAEARDLAQWDVVILDMEVAQNTPETFALLRSLNPQGKILAYVTAQEIRRDAAVHPQAPLRRRLGSRVQDSWYLKSTTGEYVSWWPQTWLLDVTDRGWTDTLAGFVAESIASDSRWDGVYYDNLWGSISWFDRGLIDLDGDGRIEDAPARDAAWVAGMRSLLTATRRQVRSGFLITGNGSEIYAELTNGLLLEHFPKTSAGDWSESMRAYFRVLERAAQPAITILNSNTQNTGQQSDFRNVRFGLTSALLGGGYYSFDFGDTDHAQRWWYDEYEAFLGNPQGAAYRMEGNGGAFRRADVGDFSPGVYRREFAHGIVIVNATNVEQRLTFDEEFERVHGTQDPKTNDGSIISEITLPALDGAILLRPIAGVTGVPFVNGAFARIFRPDGTVLRTGFFTYDGAFGGGAVVARMDLNRDGTPETITSDDSTIRVLRGAEELVRFAPFGDAFTGGITFAIGDLDRNGTWEIVVAPRAKGGTIGIFNVLEGRLLTPRFAPFGSRYVGGMSVALLDRDGDGSLEITVGAGEGRVPEVLTFDRRGKRVGAPLLAFDRAFRGGVRIAGGDLDHDGADELVVGAGPGGGPHVRVFSGRTRRLTREFFAF
ncbi:MAG: putative glycoside hydrolase, partial [bacterium]|nr:putative glycoside hydrolase [bacterium]